MGRMIKQELQRMVSHRQPLIDPSHLLDEPRFDQPKFTESDDELPLPLRRMHATPAQSTARERISTPLSARPGCPASPGEYLGAHVGGWSSSPEISISPLFRRSVSVN